MGRQNRARHNRLRGQSNGKQRNEGKRRSERKNDAAITETDGVYLKLGRLRTEDK